MRSVPTSCKVWCRECFRRLVPLLLTACSAHSTGSISALLLFISFNTFCCRGLSLFFTSVHRRRCGVHPRPSYLCPCSRCHVRGLDPAVSVRPRGKVYSVPLLSHPLPFFLPGFVFFPPCWSGVVWLSARPPPHRRHCTPPPLPLRIAVQAPSLRITARCTSCCSTACAPCSASILPVSHYSVNHLTRLAAHPFFKRAPEVFVLNAPSPNPLLPLPALTRFRPHLCRRASPPGPPTVRVPPVACR